MSDLIPRGTQNGEGYHSTLVDIKEEVPIQFNAFEIGELIENPNDRVPFRRGPGRFIDWRIGVFPTFRFVENMQALGTDDARLFLSAESTLDGVDVSLPPETNAGFTVPTAEVVPVHGSAWEVQGRGVSAFLFCANPAAPGITPQSLVYIMPGTPKEGKTRRHFRIPATPGTIDILPPRGVDEWRIFLSTTPSTTVTINFLSVNGNVLSTVSFTGTGNFVYFPLSRWTPWPSMAYIMRISHNNAGTLDGTMQFKYLR